MSGNIVLVSFPFDEKSSLQSFGLTGDSTTQFGAVKRILASDGTRFKTFHSSTELYDFRDTENSLQFLAVTRNSIIAEYRNGRLVEIDPSSLGRKSPIILLNTDVVFNRLIQGELGNCVYVSVLAMLLYSSVFYELDILDKILKECEACTVIHGLYDFAINEDCIMCLREKLFHLGNDSEDSFGLAGVPSPLRYFEALVENLNPDRKVVFKGHNNHNDSDDDDDDKAKTIPDESFLLAGVFCATTMTDGNNNRIHHAVTIVRLPLLTRGGSPLYAFHNGHVCGQVSGEDEVPGLIAVTQHFMDVMTGEETLEPNTECYVYDLRKHEIRLEKAGDHEGYVPDNYYGKDGNPTDAEALDSSYCVRLKDYCELHTGIYVFHPYMSTSVYIEASAEPSKPKMPRRATRGGGRSATATVASAVAAAALSVGALALAAVLM